MTEACPLPKATEDQLVTTIKKTLANIKKARPDRVKFPWRLNAHECVTDRLHGEPTKREILYFFARGCSWALMEGGGPCLACSHYQVSARGARVTTQAIMEQFTSAVSELPRDREIVSLYNAGSFLNPQEMPSSAFEAILRSIAETPRIRRVVLESTPDFITIEKLRDIRKWAGEKDVVIGIGVDASTPHVRRLCVNKGSSFAAQIGAFKTVRDAGLIPLAYVLLKPIFLGEKEANDEAVKTIELLALQGQSCVSLEPVSIQPGSFIDFAAGLGLYEVPSIWSVQDVVRSCASLSLDLRIGGWQYRPAPRASIRDYLCDNGCHIRFLLAIEELNGTGDPRELLGLDCACKRDWRNHCEHDPGFTANVRAFLDATTDEELPRCSAS